MSASCTAPLSLETLVDYWAGDLEAEDTDAVDEHLMGCERCSATSARIAALGRAVRALLPPIVSAADVAALRARGVRLRENPCIAGERREAVFEPDLEILLHRLGGLDLSRAERVQVVISVEETGEVIVDEASVPFERGSGEVLIACQRHFDVFPPTTVFDVRAFGPSGEMDAKRFVVPHRFVTRDGGDDEPGRAPPRPR